VFARHVETAGISDVAVNHGDLSMVPVDALRTLGVAGLWLSAGVLEEYAASPDARVEQDLCSQG